MTLIQPQTLDEIIFEHRNKDYGAYELRTTYEKTVRKSVLLGVGAFLALMITTYIIAQQKETDDKIVEVILTADPFDQPPKEQIIEEVKPPEPEQPQQKTIEFEPVVPVEDTKDIVESPPPTEEEMTGSVISTETKDGFEAESIFSAPPAETKTTETIISELPAEDNTIFRTVEVNPSFVGGNNEMYKFLAKNLKYPPQAVRANIQGKVFLSFVVEKDGSITDIDVIKGIAFGCDEEAERVVKMMPKWIAGKQNGNPVRVKFTMPIWFKLDD